MTASGIRHLHKYTYADYLAHEAASNVKHEYLDGDIYAMAGGTPEHAALAAAITIAIGAGLGQAPCVVYSSDLRIHVLATGLATYPTVTVVCGPPEPDPASRTTIVNPTLVVEVLSDSTEDWDRGEKLESYKTIPSLKECLLVSHREKRLELWRRSDGSWARVVATAGDKVELASVPCTLDIDAIYRRAPSIG
jgi:Uma2 family endonuclease